MNLNVLNVLIYGKKAILTPYDPKIVAEDFNNYMKNLLLNNEDYKIVEQKALSYIIDKYKCSIVEYKNLYIRGDVAELLVKSMRKSKGLDSIIDFL